MTSKTLNYILDSLATSESFTVPAALLDSHSKIDRALLDGKALVRSKDFLSEIPCPFGCGISEPVRKGAKDGKPFYHGRCATLKKYWTVPPEEVELLAFDKAAFGSLVRSGRIEVKGSATPPPKVDDDAADKIAEKLAAKIREKPIDTRLVDVAPSAGKGLRTAMKDPGGRPKKAHGGTNVMTQAEMATAFGSPCNENMVNGWEARAAGKNRGANPPDAIYNDERIIYSAELRTNPTPDNTKRLSALIAEFQSRHRLKEAVGEKARHMKSAETLAKASGQVTAAIREQSQLKYEK